MRALLARADIEKRDLTLAEAADFDQMEIELRRLSPHTSLGDNTTSGGHHVEYRRFDGGDHNTFCEWRSAQQGEPVQDTAEYRASFFKWLSTADERELDAEQYRALSRATGAAGNYLVPTDFHNQVIRASRHVGAIASLANVITTDSGETIQVPANTAHGSAAWTAENAAYTPSDETFAQISLGAYKGATKVIVSEELLEDSAFPLDSFLANELGERIGTLAETAFIIGDGSGKPQGILATDATANVTLHTAATGNSTSFNYEALVRAIFTLPAQYRTNAAFVVNDSTARNLYLMADDQNRPLWNVNVSSAAPDTFLGYPIYTHPDLPAPAASKISAIFGDWRKAYVIRRVNGLFLQRQTEIHSDQGQVGFRSHWRLDGRVSLAAAGLAIKHSAS